MRRCHDDDLVIFSGAPEGRVTADVVIDCRWLHFSGVGRVVTGLLEGLRDLSPPGEWVLWGPPELERWAWANARIVEAQGSPLQLLGQRGWRSVPAGRLVLFPHLVRPFVLRRGVAVIAHDTIPVRFASTRTRRFAMRVFYALSVWTSSRVLVYSDSTRRRLRSDLFFDSARLRRVRIPSLHPMVTVARRLRLAPRRDLLLYVGIDRPQKNLDRALEAFSTTAFAARGGVFRLIGVKGDLERLNALARSLGVRSQVVVESWVSDDELAAAFAAATALLMPSLEEGLGLPVVEALAAGLPVACSESGGVEEAGCGFARLFDPTSIASIASAIDDVVVADLSEAPARAARYLDAMKPASPLEFAADVMAALDLPTV